MPKDHSTDSKSLRDWLESPLGLDFLKTEQKIVRDLIYNVFGYHLLLIGEPQFMNCVLESPILHRVWIHTDVSVQENKNALVSRQDKLPILNDGVDLVYLAHCLEFNHNPHEVLREAFRVLISEGHVVISGFSPWSLWGVWRSITHYFKKVPWDGNFISVTRLKDWLALLGFDVIRIQKCFYRPPLNHVTWLNRLRCFERFAGWCLPFLGGNYIILAKKRVVTLTPIMPAWRRKKELVSPVFVETSNFGAVKK